MKQFAMIRRGSLRESDCIGEWTIDKHLRSYASARLA
jgi:hypothetical protein